MDGTARTVLHSTGLSTVYGLTLDYDDQILYWADYSNNQIESSLTDGSNRTVLTSSGIANPFSITFFDGNLYWTDWSEHRIYTLSVDSPSMISHVTSNLGQDPYGIQVITKQRQPQGNPDLGHYKLFTFHLPIATNGCLNNSHCSHICLLSATHAEGYRCVCPSGFELQENLRDCKGT